jgi:cysteinyl-tRNA synthetase
MSKSLGNFVTINELLATDKFGGRPWHGAVLRFAMMQTHYRQPIDWTQEKLRQARTELFSLGFAAGNANVVSRFRAEEAAGNSREIDSEVIRALCDDLNTSAAITRIRAIAKDARSSPSAAIVLLRALKFLGIMDEHSVHFFSMTGPITDVSVGHIVNQKDDGFTIERLRVAQANKQTERVAALRDLIEGWGVALELLADGTWSIKHAPEDDSSSKIKRLIAERAAARARKDFKESDRLRDELAALGAIVKDSKEGQTVEYKR